MTQAEAKTSQEAGELPLRGVICPYLGLRDDRSMAAHRVDGEHTCYHPQRPALIHPQIQAGFCLAGRYARCPVYREVVERPTGPPRRILSMDWARGSSGRLLMTFVFVVAIPALLGGLLAIAIDDDSPTGPVGVTRPPSSDGVQTGPGQGTAGGLAAEETTAAPPVGAEVTEPDTPPAPISDLPLSGDPLERLRDWPTLLTVDVALGDSLLSIAGEFATSVEAILLLNGLAEGDQIVEGQQLLIPLGFGDPLTGADVALGLPPLEASETEPTVEEEISALDLLAAWPDLVDVVVESGDTPGRLAARYGTTSEAVIAYNGLADAASLFLGVTVTIPVGFTEPLDGLVVVDDGDGGDGVEGPSVGDSGPGGADAFDRDALVTLLAWGNLTVWTVLPGDNLAAIAREFATTIEAIAAYNDIAVDESIFIGQTLDIPVGFQLSLAVSEG